MSLYITVQRKEHIGDDEKRDEGRLIEREREIEKALHHYTACFFIVRYYYKLLELFTAKYRRAQNSESAYDVSVGPHLNGKNGISRQRKVTEAKQR